MKKPSYKYKCKKDIYNSFIDSMDDCMPCARYNDCLRNNPNGHIKPCHYYQIRIRKVIMKKIVQRRKMHKKWFKNLTRTVSNKC